MSSPPSPFARHIVYVDEAGDHGPISPEFPVFVLAFCIFEKKAYANDVTPLMHRLKFKHLGHDAIVLHEREIRKSLPPFDFLRIPHRRAEFFEDLNTLIELAPFTVVAVVIDKERQHVKYRTPFNPYHLALKFGLERVAAFLADERDTGSVHVVFESRGKVEDQALELEFHRVCAPNANVLARRLDMIPIFATKQATHCGLQLADLIARPIGRHVMNPSQPNRAYEIIAKKLRCGPSGKPDGYGLKQFP